MPVAGIVVEAEDWVVGGASRGRRASMAEMLRRSWWLSGGSLTPTGREASVRYEGGSSAR